MDSQEKALIEEQNVEQSAEQSAVETVEDTAEETVVEAVEETTVERKQYDNKKDVLERVREIAHSDEVPQKDEIDYSNKTAFNESRQIKRLKFKNTIFLSESHLLSKVPEDYRVDENRFYMQDKTGTDYLIECKADPFGYVHMEITNKFNKQSINEELEKMKRLAGYRYSDDNKKVDNKNIETMSESISSFREKLNK